ncbi:MAG TPA: alpha/beta hydrolase [Acidimicrobiales bacterium]|nr:alpha/beta hydrolase [Acidimicrobiales bacterium]
MVDIAVHDLGGTGPPLLLAHATGFHGLVWRAVSRQLADAFHTISFDERGHGDSGLPPGRDFDWRGFGQDILTVVDGVGLERPFGVGHSSGATAMLLAEQARPGLFRAIYCYEPILVAADPPLGRDQANWLAGATRRRREIFPSRSEAAAAYAPKPPFVSWAPEVLDDYVDYGFADQPDGTVILKCRRESEALVYEMATANDAYARLGEIRCPVMLAGGADSESMTPAAITAMAGRFPNAQTEILPGVGHLGPFEQPGLVAASIRRFAETVPTPPAPS